MLPGMVHLGGQAGPPPPPFELISWNSQRNTSSSANNIPAPAGIQAGDTLVAYLFTATGGRTAGTLPDGWTLEKEFSGANVSAYVASKIADGTESGLTQTFRWSGAGTLQGVIFCYRGANGVNLVGNSAETTNVTRTAPSITPTAAGALHAVFFLGASVSPPSPPTFFTEIASNAFQPSFVVYEKKPSSAFVPTGAQSVSYGSAGQSGMGFQVQIRD